jgi:hypothetical protein
MDQWARVGRHAKSLQKRGRYSREGGNPVPSRRLGVEIKLDSRLRGNDAGGFGSVTANAAYRSLSRGINSTKLQGLLR